MITYSSQSFGWLVADGRVVLKLILKVAQNGNLVVSFFEQNRCKNLFEKSEKKNLMSIFKGDGTSSFDCKIMQKVMAKNAAVLYNKKISLTQNGPERLIRKPIMC